MKQRRKSGFFGNLMVEASTGPAMGGGGDDYDLTSEWNIFK